MKPIIWLFVCFLGSASARPPASAQQAQLLQTGQVLSTAMAGNIQLAQAEMDWIERALMEWLAFDGAWALHPPHYRGKAVMIRLIPPLGVLARHRPVARRAALALAEQWRQHARTDFDLLCAYLLAEAVQGVDVAPFAPERSDERRALSLSLQTVRAQLPPTGASPFEDALHAAFARGDDAQVLARFDALIGPDWPAQVTALLSPPDPQALPRWAVPASQLIRMRRARARFSGLSD